MLKNIKQISVLLLLGSLLAGCTSGEFSDIDEFMEEADVYIDRELALWPKREWPS